MEFQLTITVRRGRGPAVIFSLFPKKLTIFKLLFFVPSREIEDQDCKPVYEEKCTKETQHSYDVSQQSPVNTGCCKLRLLCILQVDYESKCHPVRKRICHATVPYGYLRGIILYLTYSSNSNSSESLTHNSRNPFSKQLIAEKLCI